MRDGMAGSYRGWWPGAAGAAVLLAAATLPRAVSAPAGPPPGFALAPSFAEEFDGRAVAPQRWTHAFADPGQQAGIAKRTLYGNAERQVYFDRGYLGLELDPFSVAGGVLTIRAAPLSAPARAALMADLATEPPALRDDRALRGVGYSSGLISTRGRFAQRYGYFEVRARWSRGKGLWPAFWMLPETGWPPEIDVVEAHGDKPSIAFVSTHSAGGRSETKQAAVADPQLFHRYGALWLPDRIDYYIDGAKVASLPATPDMTAPMYLLVNLAVGGYWPGDPTPDVAFPATLDVDYVRAWRLVAPGRPR